MGALRLYVIDSTVTNCLDFVLLAHAIVFKLSLQIFFVYPPLFNIVLF